MKEHVTIPQKEGVKITEDIKSVKLTPEYQFLNLRWERERKQRRVRSAVPLPINEKHRNSIKTKDRKVRCKSVTSLRKVSIYIIKTVCNKCKARISIQPTINTINNHFYL